VRARQFAVAAATAVMVSAFIAIPAMAGVFDVKGSDVEKGETEVGTNNAAFVGFPVNADRLRSSHELAVGYGFTGWLKAGAKLSFDKPADSDFQLSTAGIEAQVMLKKFGGGLGLAWFTGADFRVHRDETNTVTFGPVIQFGTEQTQLLLNPFFAKTFGRNHEEGMEFSLGWAVKQQIREGFAVGIEGYSVVPNIGNAPSADFQEHRVGPVIYLERGLGAAKPSAIARSIKDAGTAANGESGGPKLAVEAGVLFGLTEGTQDAAFKLKAGILF
jgi:hypothetical protein